MKRGSKSIEGRRRQAEAARNTHTKHGMHGTPTYRSWRCMYQRCYYKNDPFYHRYGGRGITVCPQWRGNKGFQRFLEDMGIRPNGKVLDRKDNDLPYSPDNCRWVTQQENQRNKSSTRLIEFQGETRCLAEWAEHLGINVRTLTNRLNTLKWSVERAFTAPLRGLKNG